MWASTALRSIIGLSVCALVATGASASNADPRSSVAVPPQIAANPSTEITFFMGLPYDAKGLERQARAASDPRSATFRHYLTVSEAAERFGATDEAITRLEGAARALGLTSVPDPTRLFARVTGTVAAWEKAMGQSIQYSTAATNVMLGQQPNDSYVFSPIQQLVTIAGIPLPNPQTYTSQASYSAPPRALAPAITWFLPTFQRYVPAADTPPSPASAGARSQVLIYPGSGNSPVPRNTGTPVGVSCVANGSTPVSFLGAAPANQGLFFTPDQVARAYELPRLQARYGARASGDVAILSLGGGFLQSDLQNAANCFGHTAPDVLIRLGTGVGQKFVNVNGETSLDLQTISWVLKKADRVRLVQVTNSATSYFDAYSLLLADPLGPPTSASLSYGECEYAAVPQPGWRTQEALFQLAAVVGTSLFVAAGDNGSSTCQVQAVAAVVSLADTLVQQFGDLPSVVDDYLEDLADQATPEAAQADPTIGYPASSPWVTAVGGTQLVLGEDNEIVRESVWNDLPYLPTSLVNLVGTGGTSSIFAAPWYQSPLTRRNMRTVPDISALAAVSPGMAIFVNGKLQTTGGTSEASPLTAAGSALVSQALENEGAAPLGFLNPWLYETAKAHPRLVTDVVVGSTQYPVQYAQGSVNTPACCQAGRGYDSASGFGSLRYEEFLARALR